jgi:hypothetical protein
MGTPSYAPPEQSGQETAHTDARTDIYSLGATLYHMLSGQAPPTVTQRSADPERLRPIREYVPNVSRRTQSVVAKALELPLRKRWQSAQQMADALGVTGPMVLGRRGGSEPLSGAPWVGGRPKTGPSGTGPLRARRRSPWAWVALGGLVIVVALAGYWALNDMGLIGPKTPSPAPTFTAAAFKATPSGENRPQPTSTPVPATFTATTAPSATFTTVPPTPTAVPRQTHTPTATSTPPPTPTEILATSTPTSTPPPRPTATPQSRWLPAPRLRAPENGASFTGWNAEVILEWASVGALRGDEYYVIRIPYDAAGGTAEFWRKETTFKVPPNFSGRDVGFGDRHYNWTVQTFRCTVNCDKTADDNVRKGGVTVGAQSAQGLFFWHPDQSSGGGGKPPTNTPPS